MSPVETGVPIALSNLMRRVGASVRPSIFIDAVVEVFRTVEPVSDAVVYGRFQRSRAWHDFRELLRQASLPSGARVLCLGCGRGLAGRSSVYASAVVRSVHPWADPICVDINRAHPDPMDAAYDAVVTHSLLHFVYDPSPLCEFIHRQVVPGGVCIMANEPNARFWSNRACLGEMQRVDAFEGRRHRLRRYADPSRYWSRLLRTVHPAAAKDPIAAMNRRLREQLNLHGDLTAKEIVRIADPHQRDPYPGEFDYGSDGLDWDQLGAGCRLEAVRTSGYLMRDNPANIPERWREVNQSLAAQYPLDGCSFSALWRKDGQDRS